MNAIARLIAPTAIALLATGCATLNPPPPVDLLPTAPPPVAAVPRPTGHATGGLFHAASYRPAFEDRRARMVGDTVTIRIEENITAKQNSTSTVDRKSSNEAGITALPFVGSSFTDKTKLGSANDSKFTGTGNTASSNTFDGYITTTVVEVLPNGHLVVTGEKQIGVNDNVDVLRFSGTVDPRSLRTGTGGYEGSSSVISSRLVANARVQSRGRGAQGEAQAMGWLARAFNTITPF